MPMNKLVHQTMRMLPPSGQQPAIQKRLLRWAIRWLPILYPAASLQNRCFLCVTEALSKNYHMIGCKSQSSL